MSALEKPEPSSFEIRLIGLNHRTATADVREALAYPEADAVRWVQLAMEEGAVDLGGPRIREAVLLSTCNRTEAYLVLFPTGEGEPLPDLDRRLARLLCGDHAEQFAGEVDVFYTGSGPGAVRHLYRVAAGLDSMVQGESQILGQVHAAHDLARSAGGVGPVLDRLFTSAFHAGKRSRSETEIGRGAVSVASAAVELAIKVVGSLSKRTAMVLGAGETGRLVAQHLAVQKPHELLIVNRSLDRAEALAREVGGRPLSLEGMAAAMSTADLVVAATFSPDPIITRSMVQEVMRKRRRSLVFIDISIPRNVEPAVHELDGAFVYDMDALQKVVRENLTRREGEIPKIESILDAEADQFSRWIRSLSAGPLIAQLRDHFEQVRQDEVRRHARGLQPHEVEAVERATRGLLNKMLHGPTVHLRNGGQGDPASYELIRRMFQLENSHLEESHLEEEAPAQSREESE